MADRYIVEIHIDRLQQSLNLEGVRSFTLDQTKEWLRENHFIERTDGWLCEEISLELLQKKEIKSVRPHIPRMS